MSIADALIELARLAARDVPSFAVSPASRHGADPLRLLGRAAPRLPACREAIRVVQRHNLYKNLYGLPLPQERNDNDRHIRAFVNWWMLKCLRTRGGSPTSRSDMETAEAIVQYEAANSVHLDFAAFVKPEVKITVRDDAKAKIDQLRAEVEKKVETVRRETSVVPQANVKMSEPSADTMREFTSKIDKLMAEAIFGHVPKVETPTFGVSFSHAGKPETSVSAERFATAFTVAKSKVDKVRAAIDSLAGGGKTTEDDPLETLAGLLYKRLGKHFYRERGSRLSRIDELHTTNAELVARSRAAEARINELVDRALAAENRVAELESGNTDDEVRRLRDFNAALDDSNTKLRRRNLELEGNLTELMGSVDKAPNPPMEKKVAAYVRRNTDALDSVIAERQRQMDDGRNPASDAKVHTHGRLALAASAYLMSASAPALLTEEMEPVAPNFYPWSKGTFRGGNGYPGVRKMLVIAAALTLAEIERLDHQNSIAKTEKDN